MDRRIKLPDCGHTYRTFYRGRARGKQEGWQGNGRNQERDRDRRRIAGEKPAISVRPGRQCAACPDPRGEPQNLDATMGTAGGATGYTSRLRRPELKSKLTCQGGTYCRANAPVPGGGRGLKGSRARQRLLWRWRRMRSTMRGCVMMETIFISAPHVHNRGSTSKIFLNNKTCIRCVRLIPYCLCPILLRCWELPRVLIGLRFNNQARFFDVSRNFEGKKLSKYYLVMTLPSSVPYPTLPSSVPYPLLSPYPAYPPYPDGIRRSNRLHYENQLIEIGIF